MLYKTHLAATYALALPLLASTDSLTVGNLIAVGIGSLFPDIDHPKSFIGNRTRGISDGIGFLFGHRGLAHSILGVLFFLFASRSLISLLQLPYEWGIWFIAGYIAHLIEDSFSKNGVAWLQPVYNKRIQSGFKVVYYRTGKLGETILLLLSTGAIIYQLSLII